MKTAFTIPPIVLGIFLISFPAGPSPVVSGARIPEVMGLSTIYVNSANPRASDINPGNLDRPLMTIGKAAEIAIRRKQQQGGTRIEVYPGVYRESLRFRPAINNAATIVLEAAGKGDVVVSGSDIWTDWKRDIDGNYTHAWPYQWGLVTIPRGWESVRISPLVRRREMVVVDGRALQEVQSMSQLDKTTNAFWVDESEHKLRVNVAASGALLTSAEVAVRGPLLEAQQQSNLVIRGIQFEHSNIGLPQAAVIISDSSNVLVDKCQFAWNNWTGLGVYSSRAITIEHCISRDNGGLGIILNAVNDLVVRDTETNENNWRGFSGGFTDWEAGGLKSLQISSGLFDRIESNANHSYGVWFDTDCSNVELQHSTMCGNLRAGLFLEANQGPITVSNSTICRNDPGFGLLAANSSRVILSNDIFYGNNKAQLAIGGEYDRPRSIKDLATKRTISLVSTNWRLQGNRIVGLSATQLLVFTSLSQIMWDRFEGTLISNHNVWFNPIGDQVFQLPTGRLSFSQWQSGSHDRDSVFANPQLQILPKGSIGSEFIDPIIPLR